MSSAVLQHRDIGPGAAFGSDSFGLAPAGTKSSQQVWDQSLYDAFQPGAGFDRLTGTGERRGGLDSLAPFLRERRSGVALATGGRSATPDMTLLSLNPALRSGNSLRFSSTAGTLRFNEGLGGRGYYPVARMGPGAPLASFTSPNLGNSLMNFSASTYMGGSGYGAQKHTGPSISLRLNF